MKHVGKSSYAYLFDEAKKEWKREMECEVTQGMYGYTRKVDIAFDEAVDRTRKELSKEGFGVLTEIDVKRTLKAKLDVEYDDYLILGACNPPFAYKALQAEKEVGLLLPCNVIVYRDCGETFVSAILPTAAMSIVDNDALEAVAVEVEAKLKKAVDGV